MSAATVILVVVSLAGWGQPADPGRSGAPGPAGPCQFHLLGDDERGDPLRPSRPPAAEAADLRGMALGVEPNPSGRGWAARRTWPGSEVAPLPDGLLCVERADTSELGPLTVNLQLRI